MRKEKRRLLNDLPCGGVAVRALVASLGLSAILGIFGGCASSEVSEVEQQGTDLSDIDARSETTRGFGISRWSVAQDRTLVLGLDEHGDTREALAVQPREGDAETIEIVSGARSVIVRSDGRIESSTGDDHLADLVRAFFGDVAALGALSEGTDTGVGVQRSALDTACEARCRSDFGWCMAGASIFFPVAISQCFWNRDNCIRQCNIIITPCCSQQF